MSSAALQCAQMLCALGLGLSLGMFYDIYRIFIKKQRSKAWCWFGDLAWWLLALVWSFGILVKISWADLRIPIIITVFAGIFVYLYYFSPVLSDLYKKVVNLAVKTIKRIFSIFIRILSIIFSPLVFVTGLAYKIVYGIISLIKKIGKSFKGKSNKTYHKKKSKHQAKKQAKKQKKSEKQRVEKSKKSNKRKVKKNRSKKADVKEKTA